MFPQPSMCFLFFFYSDPVLSTPYGDKQWGNRIVGQNYWNVSKQMKSLWEGFRNSLMHFKSLPAGHVICSLAWDKAFLFSGLKGQVDIPGPRRDWHVYTRDMWNVCVSTLWLCFWLVHRSLHVRPCCEKLGGGLIYSASNCVSWWSVLISGSSSWPFNHICAAAWLNSLCCITGAQRRKQRESEGERKKLLEMH